MDPLSDVLSFLRLTSYRVGGFTAGGDWSLGFDAQANIKCYAVIAGECWVAVGGAEEPIRLQRGHCFLLPHGRPFRVASDLSLPAEDWRPHFLGSPEGALIRLNDGDDVTVLGSHFELGGAQAGVLTGMMPPVVHLHSDRDRETLWWAFDRMRVELTGGRPGSILIAQQLASMIFVQVLRLYLDAGRDVGWLCALSDRHVGAAIAAMHRLPARRWTVAALADEVGMSRSGFAARFGELVGMGPIEYLTRWRMLLAGRALARGEPIGAVGRSLGYESESAFSTAFRREIGETPRRHARVHAGPGLEVGTGRQLHAETAVGQHR
jgi:AraC-like DNA-binding protein